MAGSKFQYDESGGTFFYFLLSFLALVVVPCTYYFWPQQRKPGESLNRIPVPLNDDYVSLIHTPALILFLTHTVPLLVSNLILTPSDPHKQMIVKKERNYVAAILVV